MSVSARQERVEVLLRARYGLTEPEVETWCRTTSSWPGFDTPEPDSALPGLAEIIAYLESTDPDTWWAGPTFRSVPDEAGVVRHCVISHVFEKWGPGSAQEFESRYATSYRVGADVNDGPSARYPQATPKDRVIAFLHALAAGDELSTAESMEVDWLRSQGMG